MHRLRYKRPLILGRKFEWGFFGRDLSSWTEIPPFISFLSSIHQVINKPPNDWNPLCPNTKLGNELLSLVRRYLEARLKRYYQDPEIITMAVRLTGLYDALGTAADFWWQTDGVIYCDFGWGFCNNPKITIDLKAGPDNGAELRENHFVVTQGHFSKIGENGRKDIDNLAWVMAEALAAQVDLFSCRMAQAS